MEIQWTPRTKRAAEVAATIFVENNSLATFANGVMDVRSTLDYQISQGELRQARVQLAGRPSSFARGGRIHPHLAIGGAGRRARRRGHPGGGPAQRRFARYKLSVETEKILDTFPATAAVEIPHALDVKRETGLVAARASEELSLSVDHARGFAAGGPAEFPRRDNAQNLFSVWRFLNPAFSLAIKAETVQPQIEAVVHNNVRISTEQTALSAVIDYTIKRAGVFALQVALPAGYTLDSVQGDNILQWQPRDARRRGPGAGCCVQEPGARRLFAAPGTRCARTRNCPPAVAIPGVHPLNVQKLSGFISVAAEPGVAAKTANFDGLTEIPAASLASGANTAAGVLAYKFLSAQPGPLPDWKLDCRLEKIDSWVRAEIAQVIAISDNAPQRLRHRPLRHSKRAGQGIPLQNSRRLHQHRIQLPQPPPPRPEPTTNGASNCKTRFMASSVLSSPGKSRWI